MRDRSECEPAGVTSAGYIRLLDFFRVVVLTPEFGVCMSCAPNHERLKRRL